MSTTASVWTTVGTEFSIEMINREVAARRKSLFTNKSIGKAMIYKLDMTVRIANKRWKRAIFGAGTMVMCAMLVGCHGLPRLGKQTASHAVEPWTNPAFASVANKGKSPVADKGVSRPSRVALIASGPEAFATRVAMSRFATQSLDMQYYIWDGDKTGTYLLGELLDAADRGVRVRLLLDDLSSNGIVEGILTQLTAGVRAVAAEFEDRLALVTPREVQRQDRMRRLMDEINTGGRDLVAAALDSHPNIEVRIFNPVPSRKLGSITRMLQMLGDFSHLNRRMHNKIYAADNQLAVVGGRNIADSYFGMDEQRNVRDLDLLLSGPAVMDVSSSFDRYWNSRWAVPVRAFTWKGRSEERLGALRKELALVFDGRKDPSQQHLENNESTRAALQAVTSRMRAAPVTVIADKPEKFIGLSQTLVADALGRLASGSRKEILIETAYLVPTTKTFAEVQQRRSEGVTIRILTNSLASTDALAAHAGYAKHRKGILESGVEMHELRPNKNRAFTLFGFLMHGSQAGIHTKAAVFDRQRVFVGTFNLDPRSASLNTEIGLLVEDPVLASQIADHIVMGMDSERSWQVTLGRPGESSKRGASGQLYWTAEDKDHSTKRLEPEADTISRFLSGFLSLLPIDQFL